MTSVTDPTTLPKTKKPSDSAFKQQRLPAWQPILTAGTVLPTFFVIGIAFIPVGIGLLYFSEEVKEKTIDYTNCISNSSTNETKCAEILALNASAECFCEIDFNLTEDFLGKVYMYYGLTNFYQNHRRYVKSRDDKQLLGQLSNEPSGDCAPFDTNDTETGKVAIVPCGAIANSLFSDELSLWFVDHGIPVPLLRTGIAWPTDKSIKFKNPDLNGAANLKEVFSKYIRPKNWRKAIYQLDETNDENNGFQNEDFIVWMRTAALPTFRKLYRRIDHNQEGFKGGLKHGNYKLYVNYSYNVTPFEGTKRMILSTTSLLGGKNPFLGIAYIVVGCVCLVLGIALLIIHIKCSKSTNQMINVNQNTPYQ